VSARFIPPYPPRQPKPVASWRGFFGERARTSVYGWSEFAFQTDHLKRNILGFQVHIVLDPDHVQHVLLDNAANYAKPDIVRTLLDPIIGKGLLTSASNGGSSQPASRRPPSRHSARPSCKRPARRWSAGPTASGATWRPRRRERR
jgi:hypothetical protein